MSPFIVMNVVGTEYTWWVGPFLFIMDNQGHITIIGPGDPPPYMVATFNTASSLAQSALQFEDEQLKQTALGFAREMVKLGCAQAATLAKTA